MAALFSPDLVLLTVLDLQGVALGVRFVFTAGGFRDNLLFGSADFDLCRQDEGYRANLDFGPDVFSNSNSTVVCTK